MKKLIILFSLLLPLIGFSKPIKSIILTSNNSLILRGAVTSESASRVQMDAMKLSERLGPKDEIFLVLDTPGGSVLAGQKLIETLNSLPQKVNTIVIFAASMGFQISQAVSGTRYILSTGVIMSHRASGGVNGQFDGEIESRISFYKQFIGHSDLVASKRMGISLKDYKAKIVNELWGFGSFAVKNNMVDELIKVRCSRKLLRGTQTIILRSFFGESNEYVFSKCPLVSTPIDTNRLSEDERTNEFFNQMFNNRLGFIKNYITNGKLLFR